MKQYYFKFDGFFDENQVKKVLEKDHIVKNITLKRKVQYGRSNGMGEVEPTGEYGFEDMTIEVAILKNTPDVVITEENYGDYQSSAVFHRMFIKKLFEIVTREL